MPEAEKSDQRYSFLFDQSHSPILVILVIPHVTHSPRTISDFDEANRSEEDETTTIRDTSHAQLLGGFKMTVYNQGELPL